MQREDVLRYIDTTLVVELTREMVQTMTVNPPGNEFVLAELLKKRMSDLGLETDVLPFDETRANMFCRIRGSGERPSLVFSGHLDTVPFGAQNWERDPLSGEVADGKIYGRGTSDMKGGIAAMIVAAYALKRARIPLEGDLLLAFTAGEEVDSVGATRMVEDGLLRDAGALLIAEPTGLDVCIAHKGALWLEAVTKGKAAHGSSPHLGQNAILPMAAFIECLRKTPFSDDLLHPILGECTLNIATIQGGFKTNVVPDQCRVTLDFRTVPGQDHRRIYNQIEALLTECAQGEKVRWDLHVINDREPVDTPPENPFVSLFAQCAEEVLGNPPPLKGVAYFTDGAVFVPELKIPMIICGPGEAACAHQTNEWVAIENLLQAARLYALVAARVLGESVNG